MVPFNLRPSRWFLCIAMTVLLLVLGFTQVYAKVHAFGWTGFGTFVLIAPIISLGYVWFKLKIYRLPTPNERLDREDKLAELRRSEHGL
jgi:hypothetical protein